MTLYRIGNQIINLEQLSYARLDGDVLSLQLGLSKAGESTSIRISGQAALDFWEEIAAEVESEFD